MTHKLQHTPKPAVIRKFLFNILKNDIELLCIAVLCVFVCQPEVAYRLATDLRKACKGAWIHIPGSNSQIGCSRNVRLRPVLAAWFLLFPGWSDSTRTDFRPRMAKNSNRFLSYKVVLAKLNRHLREAGWEGGSKLALHKAFLSAQVSMLANLQKDIHYVLHEVGRANTAIIRHHYDATWSPAEGYAFFSTFPPGVVNPPTRNLHQAFDQPLDDPSDDQGPTAPVA